MDKNSNLAGFAVSGGTCYLYNSFLAVGILKDRQVVCRIRKINNDARLRKFPFIRALIFVMIAFKNAILGYLLAKNLLKEEKKLTFYQILINFVKYVVYFIGIIVGGILGNLLLVALPNIITLAIFRSLDYVAIKALHFNLLNSLFTAIILIIILALSAGVFRSHFAFQNAINKAISALSNRKSLDIDVVLAEKPRYFFNPISIVFITILIAIFILPLFHESIFWLNFIYKLVLFAIILSAIYEIFIFLNQYDNKFTRIICAPSFWIQGLFQKPTDEQSVMCAIVTLKEVLMMNENDNLEIEHNLIYEWQKIREQFLANNIIDDSDVDWIFCEVLKCNRAELKAIKYICPSDLQRVQEYARIRLTGEPLQRIFGHANFYGFEFELNKDTLIPRFDTEILVETALKDIKNSRSGLKVLDMCTGSGCIAITISKLSDCQVVGVDINENALAMARINADKLNAKVQFFQSDLFEKIDKQKFDIIVSNPPYIVTSEIETLDVSNFDPHLALDGGKDGLDFYRRIIADAPAVLAPRGRIYFEIGIGQSDAVKDLLSQDFENIQIRKDYNNIDRIIYAQLKF